jgi:hypothetical protein
MSMARGPSGRFVIDLDPITKREMHSALAEDGLTLKDWFRDRIKSYLTERVQPSLPGFKSAATSHATKAKSSP